MINKKFLFISMVVIVLWALFSATWVQSAVDTTRAVIHHTASHDVSAKTIDGWHKERGWDGIGYHYIIRNNGDIEEGRSLSKNGAHARGRNHFVGIAITGYDKFTDAQIASLRRLLSNLGVLHVERHHKECPGNGLDIESIQKELTNEN